MIDDEKTPADPVVHRDVLESEYRDLLFEMLRALGARQVRIEAKLDTLLATLLK